MLGGMHVNMGHFVVRTVVSSSTSIRWYLSAESSHSRRRYPMMTRPATHHISIPFTSE